jgi:hypothetical protein
MTPLRAATSLLKQAIQKWLAERAKLLPESCHYGPEGTSTMKRISTQSEGTCVERSGEFVLSMKFDEADFASSR